MYLVHPLKLVYLAQPKTGSTSLANYLQDRHGAILVHLGDSASPTTLWSPHHAVDLGCLARHRALGYLTFTVVRNPWDYAVSWWFHYLQGNGDFSEFLRAIGPGKFMNPYNLNPDGNRETGRLFWYLPDLSDEVIRWEELDEGLSRILGIPGFQLSRRDKVADHKAHYSTYYNEADREYIRSLAWSDIETYGYEFEEGE